jgi:hypothetical protein
MTTTSGWDARIMLAQLREAAMKAQGMNWGMNRA